ncbi:UDP-2,4-diacetamido-2,4,6-trideoxy-beta-L-altropyranose hydrolase [Pseudomonas sp. CCI4.2]|uniref:UDP-2,4-diacetamido-2,4, 6-trideoxy-beta-L-altropyranose hydrolase n=1 Tax=Pseudomonas sp. CCI4.2 TaxID=3048620 RepID=UPI002AC8A877|nr:UDP-2,4-diacetamido-2,4,6-trideoxy-beta-L-altropyranose hydrolase [Pseudomonas sp. CCI4.2]MEB0093254.1 UDP-2,4-diacetamido-2,4,6-trideoxy-beta-L-altropyranose hydrolase [Pseudomonas sp. CCI4.2]WPX53609.1 UDP-2,4-diacetamido-2,4,6-trideoxy-beta-L-altropyranose hydrolase [Pseudomonas sp. CCI4.2]
MNVLIRADASHAIGSGHIARCLTLATVLRNSGAQVSFACRLLPGHLLDRLAAQGWRTYGLPAAYAETSDAGQNIEAALPWQVDIAALQQLLPVDERFDWIIVDHYGLDHQWQTAARQWGLKIAAIDDLANRRHAADLLLDQNFSGTPEAYDPWTTPACRCLLGPRFAMIRDEFKRPPVPIRAQAKRILVNFGGFDAAGETWKAMLALVDFHELEIDFVAGTGNPKGASMQAMASTRPTWRFQAHTEHFAELMAQADLFIGAGGGTSWERAALGLPTVCIAVAANQRANAEALATIGAHLYLGPSEDVSVGALRDAIGVLLTNQGIRQSFAERSRQLVDGQGARRVAAALEGEFLQMRLATVADARLLFDGRNAEAVRQWSVQAQPIGWDVHLAWLAATLNNAQRLLLIAEASDRPVGVLRYDLAGGRAEVSVYLLYGRFGLGWGRALLLKGEQFVRAHWPQLHTIDAQVLPANKASICLFQEAGYVQADCRFERALRDHSDD